MQSRRHGLGSSRFARRYSGSRFSFLSSGYLDVSVRPLTFTQPIYSAEDDQTLLWPGCPIRRSAGRRLFSASPRLIAAVHVLHRLLVPRHPPCALSILTEEHITYASLCRFQGTRGAVLHGLEEPRLSQARSFKTEQRCLEAHDQTLQNQVDIHSRYPHPPRYRCAGAIGPSRFGMMWTRGVGHRKSLERR